MRYSLVALFFACLIATTSPAAVDVFLRMEGIAGESADDRHKNEIDVLSLGHELSSTVQTKPVVARPAAALQPAAQPSKSVGPITITKYVDAASPLLMSRFASGEKVNTATLTLRKAGGKPLEFLKANLQGVTVAGYELSVSASQERPTETVTLTFDSIEWQYVRQNADGSAGPQTSASYNGR